ncbi:MAG: PilW family protein [Candidatus Aminicenantes bacterium]|nr:PilW family protein [Candidatus Aminicenantes bacterium]
MKTTQRPHPNRSAGFTMIELLVGSTVMLVAVLGALFIYARSNKVAVEQQMVTEVQNDVRASMHFITRDLRMAGVGLPLEFSSYFIEGWDNEDQGGGEVRPDRVRLMGNIEDPLNLPIRNYQGSSVVLDIEDFSFEQYPYPDEYYANKVAVVLPNPESACRTAEIRVITHVTHNTGGSNERFNFSPGLAPGIDPPGGLSGTCPSANDYDGGTISFVDVKEYWLDVTGNYPGLTAGVNGYIGGGEGGVLYCTHNAYHLPIARNIENFQIEYNGDMDNDLLLDGWSPWDAGWDFVAGQVARVQQVRVWVLGRTPQAFTSVSGTPPGGIHTYRRPELTSTPGNAPGSLVDDRHRRYLLESTSNVRNMSLNLYNLGQR